MLAQQIAAGAPFDLYLSANERFVKDLASQGHLVPETVVHYASGKIGLWSEKPGLRSEASLRATDLRHLAIPNPVHAPYGVAAEEYLKGAGLLSTWKPRLVLAENVRQAFEYARTGNADLVITSWTLIHDKGGVLLPETYTPIRQSGAVLKTSTHQAEARRFLEFLRSPRGQQILRQHGLFPPKP
jgi:molybdate transport system substrate-binding protein